MVYQVHFDKIDIEAEAPAFIQPWIKEEILKNAQAKRIFAD